ncbi:MAG: helix-turn-helix transcriptional regulator [Bacteroidetes bacterium]|nr:helix-turn-helix transcriptional regulator [Bacteroidota bacterium]
MPATNSVLDKFLGEEANILLREKLDLNSFIQAEQLTVGNTIHFDIDEGRLFLFPFDEGHYTLHLLYVQQQELSQTKISWVQYLPEFFHLFPTAQLSENIPFRLDQSTELQVPFCSQSRNLIHDLWNVKAINPLLQSFQLTEISLHLLRRAIEHVTVPFTVCPVPACRFLANDAEREKILDAVKILDASLDRPYTIKELARRVAMNECYLKKGFKTITGKTINEYQQELRIARAKQMLQHHGQTVSDVASALGYSSISHFSTAFKKATGIKPCELLG